MSDGTGIESRAQDESDGADPLTLRSCRMRMYDDATNLLATGTAFTYRLRRRLFLLTALHNLTGKNFFGGASLDRFNRFPYEVVIESHVPRVERTFKLALFRAGQPVWRVVPSADAAIIDVTDEEFYLPGIDGLEKEEVGLRAPHLYPVDGSFLQDRILIRPGSRVVVVGFPLGIATFGTLPLWKNGYISSEAHYATPAGDCIFIDSMTMKGMSGSPVFLLDGGDYATVRHTRWVGMYTGRVNGPEPWRELPRDAKDQKFVDHDVSSGIGIVWNVKPLLAALREAHPDDIPQHMV